MSNYIRQLIELFVRKCWLREIERQLNAVNSAIRKAHQAKQTIDQEKFVLQKLIDEDNKLYHDGIGVKGD